MNQNASNEMASAPKARVTMTQLSSCFLCLFENDQLTEFVGPMLSDEIAEELELAFEPEEIPHVQVIDEKIFRILHAPQYYEDFLFNWDVYVGNLAEILRLEPTTMGLSKEEDLSDIIDEEDESKNYFILLPSVGQVMKANDDTIVLSIFMDADPVATGQFCCALTSYLPANFTLQIDYEYFALDGNLYKGEEARQMFEKDMQEEALKNITLNLN